MSTAAHAGTLDLFSPTELGRCAGILRHSPARDAGDVLEGKLVSQAQSGTRARQRGALQDAETLPACAAVTDLHAVSRGHNESILDLVDEPEKSAELLWRLGGMFREFTEELWKRVPLFHGGYFDA